MATAEVKFSVDREQLRHAIEEMVGLQVRAVAETLQQIRAYVDYFEPEYEALAAAGNDPVATGALLILRDIRKRLSDLPETSERRAESGEEVTGHGRDASDAHRGRRGRPGVVTPP